MFHIIIIYLIHIYYLYTDVLGECAIRATLRCAATLIVYRAGKSLNPAGN